MPVKSCWRIMQNRSVCAVCFRLQCSVEKCRPCRSGSFVAFYRWHGQPQRTGSSGRWLEWCWIGFYALWLLVPWNLVCYGSATKTIIFLKVMSVSVACLSNYSSEFSRISAKYDMLLALRLFRMVRWRLVFIFCWYILGCLLRFNGTCKVVASEYV